MTKASASSARTQKKNASPAVGKQPIAVPMPGAAEPPAPATMQAAVLVQPGKIEVREAPVPRVGPSDIRVRLEGCGVCASNLPPWEGREWFTYPFEPGQLGHEGWGVVEAVGREVRTIHPGDRVAVLSQKAYAQYDVCDQSLAAVLPHGLSGRPFPGEPLGCAMNIFARSGVGPGVRVAIVGIGFLGAILTRLCSRMEAEVIALARRPFALGISGQLGARHLIPMDDHWKIIQQVKDLTGGKMCDVVIEATGKQWPLDLSGELTGERGRLVVAGYHQDGLRQVNMQLWNWRGLDVINAHERDPRVYMDGIQSAIAAVALGELEPDPLYTHAFRLDQLDQALTCTQSRPDGFLKALVRM